MEPSAVKETGSIRAVNCHLQLQCILHRPSKLLGISLPISTNIPTHLPEQPCLEAVGGTCMTAAACAYTVVSDSSRVCICVCVCGSSTKPSVWVRAVPARYDGGPLVQVLGTYARSGDSAYLNLASSQDCRALPSRLPRLASPRLVSSLGTQAERSCLSFHLSPPFCNKARRLSHFTSYQPRLSWYRGVQALACREVPD